MHLLGKFLIALTAAVIAAVPAHAEWLRAESRNFVVYSEGSDADLRERVTLLEDYSELLRTLTGTETPPSPNKLNVYLVRGRTELETVRDLPPGSAGVYITGSDGIAAVADMADRGAGANAVLFHEYAHHFMMQYHGRVYPTWYVEGFAEYMMTARLADRTIEFGHMEPARARVLADTARWLPMEEILFGAERRPETAGRFYAQSWLLTHYLLDDPVRLERYRAYLAALARGEDPRRAFADSFGLTPNALERELRRHAFGGLTFRRLPRSSSVAAPDIRIERLPPSADDLLLLQAAMRVGLRDEGERLARIRREAARHQDAYSRRVLAQAEALYGDAAAADQALEPLIAAEPDDAELMYLRGMRFLRAARAADGETRRTLALEARRWFSRTHRADPSHFQTLYRYIETFVGDPDLVSEANVEVLLLAHSLAPQAAEIRMAAVRMLILLGDFALAEGLLAPMAGSAHQGSLTAPARELLAKARNRSSEGVAVTF